MHHVGRKPLRMSVCVGGEGGFNSSIVQILEFRVSNICYWVYGIPNDRNSSGGNLDFFSYYIQNYDSEVGIIQYFVQERPNKSCQWAIETP